MTEKQRFADGEVAGRRYEYDDRSVLVADFGTGVDGTVDLVGDTAIVVVGDDQYEFEVPAGVTARASMNNGVLTVEAEGSDADMDSDSDAETGVED